LANFALYDEMKERRYSCAAVTPQMLGDVRRFFRINKYLEVNRNNFEHLLQ